jgi:predicted cupin superfamily sugar epimerase
MNAEMASHIVARPAPPRSQLDAMNPIGIVGAHFWQAARSLGAYSLLDCNVGPGFEFEDFHFVSAVSALL